jgi:serine/threonine protein kinase/WD40 repeat protein
LRTTGVVGQECPTYIFEAGETTGKILLRDAKIDPTLLSSLLQFDESLRNGQLTDTQLLSDDKELLGNLELGQAAMLELEAAIPRRVSVMPSWAPQNVGRFEIRSVLGTGGFAVVYLAFDPVLNRQVALKIPRPHALMKPELRRRFVTEAQAAAKLDHPNIVPVYEAGEDRDLPYIACAYCEGPTLASWLASKAAPLKPKLAAEIVRKLARAVQYSHERGILHRDIKPGNVLLFPHVTDGNERFPFVARLGDFGLAKLLESGELDTVTSQLIGTPRYMAPEIIKGTGKTGDVTPDVYALGALLYCLVLGQAPFGSATAAETLRKIVDSDAISPDTIDPSVGRDLSLVCMKCLQKSPHQRYQSAAELAEDLDRFLSSRPVLARETPVVLRIEKWCRRRPLVAVLMAIATSLTIILLGLAVRYTTSMQRLQGQLKGTNQQLKLRVADLNNAIDVAGRNKTEAETNRRIADEQVFAADLKLADSLRQSGDVRGATSILDRYSKHHTPTTHIDGQSSFAWRYLKGQTSRKGTALPDSEQTIWDMELSPSGDRLAQCGNKGIVRIQDVQRDFKTIIERQLAPTEFNSIAWCDTEPILATCADDGLVRVYSAEDLQLLRTLEAFPGKRAYGLAFLPGTTRLYVGGDSEELQAWNAVSGELVQKLSTPHSRGIENLVASADGTRIVTGGYEGHLCLWRAEDHSMLWQQTITLTDLTGPVTIVQITPDGKYIVACVMKDSIIVCDASTGTELRRWQGLDRIQAMVADNNRVICGDSVGIMSELRLQDDDSLSPWRPVHQWPGHDAKVSSIVVIAKDSHCQNSTEVMSTDREGRVWQWSADAKIQTKTFSRPKGVPGHFHNSFCWKDATTLLRSRSNGIQSLNIESGESADAFSGSTNISTVRYSMETDRLVVADSTGQVTLIPRDGAKRSVISVWKNEFIDGILIDQSGSRALAFDHNQNVAVLDLHRNQVLLRLADRESSTISPNGRWIVSADRNSDAFDVSDGETLERIKILEDVDPTDEYITFSQDSRLFVSVGMHRMVTVWDSETWSVIQQISVPSRGLHMPTFHPDGRTLAIGDDLGFIRLIDIRSGRELFAIGTSSSSYFHGLGFSPDGNTLGFVEQNWDWKLITVGE